ncbi:MAG: glycosyltransferase [Phycisphaeraceae bacterium]|nr:glycosyltransferase [Phycisphaeraceae bacterium]
MTSGSSTRLQILHYLPRILLAEGGLVRAVWDLSSAMASRGHAVTLLSYDVQDAPDSWMRGEAGFPRVVRLDWPRLPRQILSRRSLNIVSDEVRRADIVHCHGPFMIGSLQTARVARRLGCPCIFTLHGMLDDWSMSKGALRKRAFLALGVRRCLEQASRVHCTAQAELDQARKWFPQGRGVVLPYLVDTQPYAELPGPAAAQDAFVSLRNDEPRILFMGRLHPKKGIELLLGAAGGLRDAGLRARLIIAGPGEETYIKALRLQAQKLGIADRVDFLGLVTGRQKLSLYQACDVLVLPTSQENFGLVLIEAMACGTPVVTTRGVDIWREISQAGATIIERTEAALTEALRILLADPQALSARGTVGRQWVLSTFAPAEAVGKYEALYREVIAEHQARR